MLTLVVARYNEDVSWVNLIPGANVVIVNKSAIGNTGREASSYLWFIAKHYHALEGDYLFCQGDPFPHCPDFVERVAGLTRNAERGTRNFGTRLQCDWDGKPHHPGLPISRFWQDLEVARRRPGMEDYTLDQLPTQLEFTAGAQFLRTAGEIHRGFYDRVDVENALRLANSFEQAPWVLERLWDYLIPISD